MIYVISDIHGHEERFDSIIKQIDLKTKDTLYVLGDVIDRGKNGVHILQKIMKMPNVKMLLGNHELMMLDAIERNTTSRVNGNPWKIDKEIRIWYENGGRATHEQFKDIDEFSQKEILIYLNSLPLNIDVRVNGIKYKLVHASPVERSILENYRNINADYAIAEYAVWKRWAPGDNVPDGYTLIFGHTPTCHLQEDSPWCAWKGDNAIGIDCGCGFSGGRLLCLRLDDGAEFYAD